MLQVSNKANDKHGVNHKTKVIAGGTVVCACCVLVGFASLANVKVSDTASTTFHFGGTVAASCKVNNIAASGASNLTINGDNAAQNIGSLEVWCNTGNNASTQYTSANGGFLVSGDNKIAYTLAVGDGSEIDLARDYINSNTNAGTGSDGSTASHQLTITPKATGLDSAGEYSDTITVTVTYN